MPETLDEQLIRYFETIHGLLRGREPLFGRALGPEGYTLRVNRVGFSMEKPGGEYYAFHLNPQERAWYPVVQGATRKDHLPMLVEMVRQALEDEGWYDSQDPDLPDELKD